MAVAVTVAVVAGISAAAEFRILEQVVPAAAGVTGAAALTTITADPGDTPRVPVIAGTCLGTTTTHVLRLAADTASTAIRETTAWQIMPTTSARACTIPRPIR